MVTFSRARRERTSLRFSWCFLGSRSVADVKPVDVRACGVACGVDRPVRPLHVCARDRVQNLSQTGAASATVRKKETHRAGPDSIDRCPNRSCETPALPRTPEAIIAILSLRPAPGPWPFFIKVGRFPELCVASCSSRATVEHETPAALRKWSAPGSSGWRP